MPPQVWPQPQNMSSKQVRAQHRRPTVSVALARELRTPLMMDTITLDYIFVKLDVNYENHLNF